MLEELLSQRERLEQQILRDTTAARRWRNPDAARILAEVAQALPADGALLLIEVTRPTFYPSPRPLQRGPLPGAVPGRFSGVPSRAPAPSLSLHTT